MQAAHLAWLLIVLVALGLWVPDGFHDLVVLPEELGEYLPGGQGHPLQDGQGCLGVRQAVVQIQEALDDALVCGSARSQDVGDVERFPATQTAPQLRTVDEPSVASSEPCDGYLAGGRETPRDGQEPSDVLLPAPTDGVRIPDPVMGKGGHPQGTGGSGAGGFQPRQPGADKECLSRMTYQYLSRMT